MYNCFVFPYQVWQSHASLQCTTTPLLPAFSIANIVHVLNGIEKSVCVIPLLGYTVPSFFCSLLADARNSQAWILNFVLRTCVSLWKRRTGFFHIECNTQFILVIRFHYIPLQKNSIRIYIFNNSAGNLPNKRTKNG